MDTCQNQDRFFRKLLFLLLVFLTAFAGYWAANVAFSGGGCGKGSGLYRVYNSKGEQAASFGINGDEVFGKINGEDNSDRAAFGFSEKEGFRFVANGAKDTPRFYLKAEGEHRGITMPVTDGESTAFSLLVREKDGAGGGRLYLGTPGRKESITEGFREDGTPCYTMKTADGASIVLAIKDGIPSIELTGKDGRKKTIQP